MKTVNFNNVIQVVHIIDLEYDFETYKNARSGQEWLNHAVDRCRFKNRINVCKDILESVFNDDHRSKMLKTLRF